MIIVTCRLRPRVDPASGDPGLMAYMNIQQRRRLPGATTTTPRECPRSGGSSRTSEELLTSRYWYARAVLVGDKRFVLDGDRSAARQTAADSLAYARVVV